MKNLFKLSYVILLIIILIHLVLLSRLVFFPYPELFIYSYLTSEGLLPYKQILDQHFPGLMFFPINLHTLGMITPQIARYWHLGLVALTHALLFIVGKKMFKSGKWALLVNFLFLLWQPFFEGYVLWIDSFLPLLLLPAFYFIYKWLTSGKLKHIFLSGFFLGLALLFKQVMVPLIIFIFILVAFYSKKIKSAFVLGIGILIPISFLILYILRLGVWQDFYFWTITFNLTTFAQMGRKYPNFNALVKTLPIFGLATVLWFIHFMKTKSRNFLYLGTFFFGSLVFAYARFDYIHLQPALPFGLLILVYLFLEVPKKFRSKTYLFFIILTSLFLIPFFKTHMGSKTFFFGKLEREVSTKVIELTETGDSVLALATMPHLYQMTNTLPPGRVFVFQFPWFMVQAQDRILSGIISDSPKVVVRDKEATTGGQNLISYMEEIDKYVRENYEVVETIGDTEILTKK